MIISRIVLPLVVLAVVVVECSHMFTGTNVFRQEVYHREVKYRGNKGYEYLNYTIPAVFGYGRTIQVFFVIIYLVNIVCYLVL